MKLLPFSILILCTTICSSQVVINEVQSSNSSTLTDNNGDYDDWIELYNPNDYEVDIGGLVLKDQVDVWQIPTDDTNTVLPAYGYFLLWADDEESQGNFHTNFKLSASNGEFLGLYESDSVTEIESVNIPPLSEDESYGKCNGTSWVTFDTLTPLAENTCLNSIAGIRENNGLVIYPAVAEGDIKINLQDYSGELINLYLYSVDGKLVLNRQFDSKEFTVNLSDLTDNMYIVNIFTGKNSYTDKIVLSK